MASCIEVEVKVSLGCGWSTVVDSSTSSSLMLDGGSVSNSSGEMRGGIQATKEAWTTSSKTVAHSRRRSSACKTDMDGRCLGSRCRPICMAA